MAEPGPADLIWKAIPEEHWPTDEEQREYILSKWQEPFGDMRQELVFIGQHLDKTWMIEQLDNCLLDNEELMRGQGYWKCLPDPFPAW